MKTAIYIEDGTLQLVLTPDTKFEKDALKTLISKKVDARIMEGSFFECAGGWFRQSHSFGGEATERSENSLIIRVSVSASDVKP